MEFRFQEPARDFSDGLQVLRDYHDSLLAKGRELLDCGAALNDQGATKTNAQQAVGLHLYFTRANHLHHQDEEKGLFPLIFERSILLDGMMERLILDHQEIEAAWTLIAPTLAAPENRPVTAETREATEAFEKLQRQHLTRENEDFLPKIEELVVAEEQKTLGANLARIRGVQSYQQGGDLVTV